MKKFIYLIMLLIGASSISSCDKEVEMGFPSCITFTSNGGEEVINASSLNYPIISHANIHNYDNGDHGKISKIDNTYYSTYEWLKIEYTDNGTDVKVVAEPNTTGKSRKLHIEIYCGKKYDTVKVEQNK